MMSVKRQSLHFSMIAIVTSIFYIFTIFVSASAFVLIHPAKTKRTIRYKNANADSRKTLQKENGNLSLRQKEDQIVTPNRNLILMYTSCTDDANNDNVTDFRTTTEGKVELSNSPMLHSSETPPNDCKSWTEEGQTIQNPISQNFLDPIRDWFKSQFSNKEQDRTNLPIQIQDTIVLYYDIFLILNLSVSISFWVIHRLSLFNILEAFNEGCLLSILWIVSGLYNGAFLYTNIDGNYDMTKDDNVGKGGPKAAGMVGLWTFVGTINLRMLVALLIAVNEHRPVGTAHGEELIPLELCFGLVLMSMWRMLHSTYSRL